MITASLDLPFNVFSLMALILSLGGFLVELPKRLSSTSDFLETTLYELLLALDMDDFSDFSDYLALLP
jgi:hypothetical protein